MSRLTGHLQLCASEFCSLRESDIIGDNMREVVIQQVSLGANGGLRLRPCPIGPSGYKYVWRAAMSVRWDEHEAELFVAYVGGVPDITLVEDFRLIVSAVAIEHGDRLVLSPSTTFVGVPSEVVALLRGMAT
jgi:hypothetical protein